MLEVSYVMLEVSYVMLYGCDVIFEVKGNGYAHCTCSACLFVQYNVH